MDDVAEEGPLLGQVLEHVEDQHEADRVRLDARAGQRRVERKVRKAELPGKARRFSGTQRRVHAREPRTRVAPGQRRRYGPVAAAHVEDPRPGRREGRHVLTQKGTDDLDACELPGVSGRQPGPMASLGHRPFPARPPGGGLTLQRSRPPLRPKPLTG